MSNWKKQWNEQWKKQLKGIIPALITPYTAEGDIDETVTRQLVRHLIAKGVSGFYTSGSTGEGFLQTPDERKRFLEIVIDETGGELPVIAHVGAMDTRTCIDLTRHAALVGAAAVSAVTPFYYKFGPEQIRQHYIDMTMAAEIPLIVYHFPDLTGARTSVDFYQELSREARIVGLKFTSRDVYEMQQIMDTCGDDFLVFNGPDEICLAGLTMGACGAIGSTYNIMPELFVSLYEHVQAGNIGEAKRLQYVANRLIRELLKYDFIAFEREVLRLQGFEVGRPRKPLQQLTEEERDQIRRICEQHPFLNIQHIA